MNPSVDKAPSGVTSAQGPALGRDLQSYITVVALPVCTVLMFGQATGGTSGLTALMVVAGVYLLTIYLYYGLARLAFSNRSGLLWSSAAAAVVVGLVSSGGIAVGPMLLSCGMMLVASIICGRLTARRWRPVRVYILGAATVAAFFSAQYFSLWSELAAAAPEVLDTAMADLKQMLLSLGYSQEAARSGLDQTRRLGEIFVRIVPALTVIGAVFQFSLGYLLFVRHAERQDPALTCAVPFTRWRVPFAVTPVLVVTILARLVGNETARVAADNVLVGLSVFYCLAGLALMEYYLRKLNFSAPVKILFYMLMFFTHLIGFFVAALLGFVDSFADWRNRPAAQAV